MKKLLFLSALLIFACSSDDSNDDNIQNNSIIIDGSEYPLSRVEILVSQFDDGEVYVAFYDMCYHYNVLNNSDVRSDLLDNGTPVPFFQAAIGTYNEGFLASGTYQVISRTSDIFVGDADVTIQIYPYDNETDVQYSSEPYGFSSLYEENNGVLNVERISSNNYSFSWNFVAKQGFSESYERESPFSDYPLVSGSYSGQVILMPDSFMSMQDCD